MVLKITNLHILRYLPTCWLYLLERYTIDNQRCTHTVSEISESVHRAALDAAFANGNIGSYDEYLKRLKEGYGLQNVKLGHNKAVKVATLLSDKQMVIKEGKDYAFNPEYHY